MQRTGWAHHVYGRRLGRCLTQVLTYGCCRVMSYSDAQPRARDAATACWPFYADLQSRPWQFSNESHMLYTQLLHAIRLPELPGPMTKLRGLLSDACTRPQCHSALVGHPTRPCLSMTPCTLDLQSKGVGPAALPDMRDMPLPKHHLHTTSLRALIRRCAVAGCAQVGA